MTRAKLAFRLLRIAQRFNSGSAARNAVSPGGTKEVQQHSKDPGAKTGFFRPFRDSDDIAIFTPALKRWAIIG
jgi:hypothetical protein